MVQTIKEIAVSVLGLLLIAIANEAVRALKNYLDGATERAEKDKLMNMKFWQMTLFKDSKAVLDEIIKASVTAMEQSTAGDLRKLVKEGVVSKEALKSLSKEVFERVNTQLGYKVLENLNIGLTDLDKYIKDKIEASVAEIKKKSSVELSSVDLTDKVKEFDEKIKAAAEKEVKEEYTGELLEKNKQE